MSKVKKTIIACVIFALLLIGTLYGLTIYSASLPTPGDLSYLENEVEEGTKYPVLTEPTYFGSNWAEYIDDAEGYYLPILKKADSKYIWLDDEDGIWGGYQKLNFSQICKEQQKKKVLSSILLM